MQELLMWMGKPTGVPRSARAALAWTLIVAFAPLACGKKATTPKPTDTVSAPAANPNADPQAPDTFRVRMQTSKGDVVVRVIRAWAPRGADRFHHLVQIGFFDDARFFRVVPNFMAQFGMAGDPKLNEQWSERNIIDDPPKQSNTRGRLTFAAASLPNSRSTQLFINLKDNAFLDATFAPIGEVVEGMNVVDQIYSGYGEASNRQDLIAQRGNQYLTQFPKLDYIKSARIIE
jgi:peptidyl-prolyl cis-trans isomerase A (cyclophilin A)